MKEATNPKRLKMQTKRTGMAMRNEVPKLDVLPTKIPKLNAVPTQIPQPQLGDILGADMGLKKGFDLAIRGSSQRKRRRK